MSSGIEIATISIRILEQQLQLSKELETGLTRAQDRAQSGVKSEVPGIPVAPSLEQGEIIPARVLENMGPGRYLVLIKDTPFIADSHVSLASGSDITVRVERAAPDIRLALVKPTPESQANQASQANTINEYMKWQRANPDGIKNLLTTLAERLEPPKTQNPQSAPLDQNTQFNRTNPNTQTAQNNPSAPINPDAQGAHGNQSAQTIQADQNTQISQIIQNAQNNVSSKITPNAQITQIVQSNQNTQGAQINQNAQEPLTAKLSPESAARLLSLVKRLQFSGEVQDNNWVRNYARDLGLTVESELLKTLVSGMDVLDRLNESPDLKRTLTEIAALIQAENPAAPGAADPGGMKALSALVESGIKNIEALQIANVVLQDTQGSCAFQAPIVFQENRGTAHLFIEGDGQEGAGKKGVVHKFLLLLDLDRLGAMRVEASVAEGRIDCLFRCDNSAARDLVTGGLEGLKESLEAAGCRVSTLGCITDSNIGRENQVSLNERLARGDSLSLFA